MCDRLPLCSKCRESSCFFDFACHLTYLTNINQGLKVTCVASIIASGCQSQFCSMSFCKILSERLIGWQVCSIASAQSFPHPATATSIPFCFLCSKTQKCSSYFISFLACIRWQDVMPLIFAFIESHREMAPLCACTLKAINQSEAFYKWN